MDEKLYTIVKEALPQIASLNEKFIACESSIQGVLSLDGKDISEMIKKRDCSSLLAEDPEKLFSDQSKVDCNVTPSMLEQIANSFKSYPNDVLDYFSCFITLVRNVNTSLDELIPSYLDEDGKEMAKYIEETSTLLSKIIAFFEAGIQATLKNIVEQEQPEDETQASMRLMGSKFVSFSLVHSLIGLSFIAISCIHLHQVVYEYYYGAKYKKSENADMIKQIVSNINTFLSPQLNSIKKDIEQITKDKKEYIKELETIKNKQEKTDDRILRKSETIIQKVENRNKVERRKKLTQKYCAKIIREKRQLYNEKREDFLKEHNILKYYREFSVPETNSIKREIQRWERFLKTNGKDGITPPANFTRMTSELEFQAFAERLELEKYNEWKAFITEKYLTMHNNNL